MKIHNFFNNLLLCDNILSLQERYRTATPLPHLIIDNFLPDDIFKELCNDITNYPTDKWIIKQLSNSTGIRKEARDFSNSQILHSVMMNLLAQNFVKWLGTITDSPDIIPDPHYLGAGLTSTPSGSSLGLHVDFNWNNTLRLNRKFNLILYANSTWEDSWNGELEFWNKENTQCIYTIKPTPNRLIFWEYEQDLIHGFTKPLACPPEIDRQNLMTIYYTSNATPNSQPHKSQFY